MQLRQYQENGINQLSTKYAQGIRKIIFQLPTGGGKTITFAGLIHRYLLSVDRKIVIVVHRDELLKQSKKTIHKWYSIVADAVVAGVKYINPKAKVYVTMVETANNRLKKDPQFFGDVGMVIIDEAHLGNFKKLHEYFPDPTTLIVGFTATPISAVKKHPLNTTYEDIVCSTDIPELIAQGALVGNQTYVVKSVRREDLDIKNGEFDNEQMGTEYSKAKHIHNTIKGYEKHSLGKKTIVFNCNVEHSKKVCEAFRAAGYKAEHLDGTMSREERTRILQWFAVTDDAIMCNIAILTTGFDEPTIQTVIINRSTKSLPLWLQMTGRGSRPFPGKAYFTILDMGGNAMEHGDWCQRRDWDYIFRNPPKPGKNGGVPPIKICANEDCAAIISANANTCQYCGADQPVAAEAYDTKDVEFELLESSINVASVLQQAAQNGYNGYAALHQVKHLIVSKAREQSGDMSSTRAYGLLEVFQHKVAAWCKEQGKNYDQWHKDTTAQWFFAEIKRVFHWEPETLSIAL
jgi:superfamily II DNA or RNA helicase